MDAAGRILLIDDSPVALRLIAAELQEHGYAVASALGGAAGLEAFGDARLDEARRFDLVVTDLNMPEVSGLQVLASLRPHSPEVPVIVLTSQAELAAVREALRAGACDYVVKEEGPELLRAAVDRALTRAQAFRRTYVRRRDPTRVLAEHAARNATGELVVVGDACEVHVHLQGGRVAWATSSGRRRAFTAYLVQRFGIDPERIAATVRACRRDGTNIGERLVADGVADLHQVREALRLQVHDALSDLAGIRDARTLFLSRSSLYAQGLTFALDELRPQP